MNLPAKFILHLLSFILLLPACTSPQKAAEEAAATTAQQSLTLRIIDLIAEGKL